jgi:hypothetical protein
MLIVTIRVASIFTTHRPHAQGSSWLPVVTRGARVVMRGRIVGLVAVICWAGVYGTGTGDVWDDTDR